MSYVQLFLHLVWATFERTPWITGAAEQRLWTMIAARCRTLSAQPLSIGGIADHIHLLVSLPPTLAVAKLVSDLKGASSHAMTHLIAPGQPFRWQGGYSAFTLRRDDIPTLEHYIRSQATHHARQTLVPDWEPPTDPPQLPTHPQAPSSNP